MEKAPVLLTNWEQSQKLYKNGEKYGFYEKLEHVLLANLWCYDLLQRHGIARDGDSSRI